MQGQDTPRPLAGQYRGSDWTRIQQRWQRTASPAGAAAAPAATRLGSSTHFVTYPEAVREFPHPSYLATLTGYGPNGAELVYRTTHEQPRDPTRPRDPSPRASKTGTPRVDLDPIDVQKSAYRARAAIKRWIRTECVPGTDWRLVTLSRRGGLADPQACWDAVAMFRRGLQRISTYREVRIIAVPELHKGGGANHGTYHVHCILVFPRGVRPIYGVFHRIWKRALGGTGDERGPASPGNCDFAPHTFTRANATYRYTPVQAARYLAKYVTKDIFGGKSGQKRFTTTHGSATPPKRYWWEPIHVSHSWTCARAVELLRRFYPAEDFSINASTFHDGGDTYHVFSAEPVPRLIT